MRFQDDTPVELDAPAVADAAEEPTRTATDMIADIFSFESERMAAGLTDLADVAMPMVMNLAVALLIVIASFVVAGWFSKLVRAGIKRAKVDETLGSFFGQMAYWAVVIIGVIAAIGQAGIPTASFVAVLGGASLAIGLAFQGSLGNLASGVMLLLFRPMRVGDVISTAGITAKVHEIGLFATTFDTPDNRRIIVPNGGIFGSTIENISHHETRRADVAVGTDYSADLDKTRAVLEEAARKVEGALDDPEPVIYLNELGDSAISWTVRIWCKAEDYWAVRERGTRDVKVALDNAGIGIPFPQMDVHLNKIED